MTKRRSLSLPVLLACLVYAGVEGMSSVGLKILAAKQVTYQPLSPVLSPQQRDILERLIDGSPPLSGHHRVLGWTPKPHTNAKGTRINSQGIRADRDYAEAVDTARIRVSAFGDSFTFGSEVGNEDTWERQLETRDPRFEVLNFGVGAYGLDQAYLRYLEDGAPFNSDIVVIGFMSENIYRNLNVFRPFYAASYWPNVYTKPRFSLDNGSLVLRENPLRTVDDYRRFLASDAEVLREIGTHDYFYDKKYLRGPMDGLPSVRLVKIATRTVKERLNPVVTPEGSYAVSAEGFRLTERLLAEFHCAALRNGSLPVVVVYPDLGDFSRHRARQPRRYAPLIERLRVREMRVVDLLDALAAHDPSLPTDRLTVGKWGHYSRLGNTIVAAHLQKYLDDENLATRNRIKRLVREACASGRCCADPAPADVISPGLAGAERHAN